MAKKHGAASGASVVKRNSSDTMTVDRRWLWILGAIIVLLLFLLIAEYNQWLPHNGPQLGSAFNANNPLSQSDGSPNTNGNSKNDTSSANDTNSANGNASGGATNSDGNTSGANGTGTGATSTTGSTPQAADTSANGSTDASTSGATSSDDGSSSGQAAAPPTSQNRSVAPSSTSGGSIVNLAANLNAGDSLATVQAKAGGLSSSCAVVTGLTLPILGEQKVCLFSQNGKLITVTLLNNRVIGASRSGF